MLCASPAMRLSSAPKGACQLFTTAPAKPLAPPRAWIKTHTLHSTMQRPSTPMGRMQVVRVASVPYASDEDVDEDQVDDDEVDEASANDDVSFDEVVAREDLWQYEDRHKWYLPTYAADDAPDWNPATFLHAHPACTGAREVVLEIEISRELVPIRNAYLCAGQRLQVRVNGGELIELPVCSPPFPKSLNREPLFLLRHDLPAGETKRVSGPVSVRAPVALFVEEAAGADVWNLSADDLVEVGPFVGGGLNIKPLQGIFQFPTIIMFVSGAGIAAARALIEGGEGSGLCFPRREAVVLYYSVPNASSVAFGEHAERWQELGVRVVTSTRDTFQEMFDYDDELVYEPSQTAALVLTGGDEEAEAAALEACREAEIEMVVKQSCEAGRPVCRELGGERIL